MPCGGGTVGVGAERRGEQIHRRWAHKIVSISLLFAGQIKKRSEKTWYWIGMYIRRDKSGKAIGAVWMDGAPVGYGDPTKVANKVPWSADNPSNTGSKECCIHLYGTPAQLQSDKAHTPEMWNDFDCSTVTAWGVKAGAVCKRPACARLCEEVAKKCPGGWAQLDKFCYKVWPNNL